MRWLPTFASFDWSGSGVDDNDDVDVEGFGVVVEWLGLVMELCIGRVRR